MSPDRQIELGEEDEQGGEEDDLGEDTMEMNVNYTTQTMGLDVSNDNRLEITLHNDKERRAGGYSEWIPGWFGLVTEQIILAVMYVRETIMGQE